MDVLKIMKKCAHILGLKINEETISIQLIGIIIVAIIIIMNVILYTVDKWDDMQSRILSLKALIFLFPSLCYYLTLTFNWCDILPLVNLIGKTSIRISYVASPQRKELFDVLEMKVRRINYWWSRMLLAYVSAVMVPLFIVIVKVVFQSVDIQHIIKEPTYGIFPIYYPEYFKRFERQERLLNIIFYFTGYAMHFTCAIGVAASCQLVCVSTLSALVNVEYELKLLELSLVEMDAMIDKSNDIHNKVNSIDIEDGGLHWFCTYFILHHQQTYRKFEMVSRGVRWIALPFCFFNSLYTCLALFTIIKQDKIMLKLQELLSTSIYLFGTYLYDNSGERTKTEHEILRNAIYECSWQEKPEWFKKAMLIIMTRTCRPFDMKPFGLFGFSRNGFATRINAAYCYYNFLSKFN